MAAKKKLHLTQVRSSNGANKRQIGTLQSLGLGRIGKSAEVADDPTVHGAIHKVRHLVKVDD